MPLFRQSATEAWESLRRNRHAGWPSKREAARLSPVAEPQFGSDFVLRPEHRVFTIGSCFARNIEEALVDSGLDVLTARYAVPETEWEGRGNGILNKYHPFAILHELEWALDPGKAFPWEHAFIDTADGQWVDLHLPGAARPVDHERVRGRREEILALYRQITDCDLIILTPGLVEAWWDNDAACYTDRTIPRALATRYGTRFEHCVLSYADVHAALEAMVSLIRAHCRPAARIVFSVSPVPLAATFTTQDILCANTYSKSVLRAAVEQVVSEHEGVDYFPSFESITLSDRENVFGDDFIHVKDTAVRANIARFLSAMRLEVDTERALQLQGMRAPRTHKAKRAVSGMVSPGIRNDTVTGWAFARSSPDPVTVSVLVNEREVATALCNEMRAFALQRGKHPTGLCGFSVRLPETLPAGAHIRVRDRHTGEDLANSPFVYAP